MNRWFSETFLPSIFARCESKGYEMWLSQKQTQICIDNMELHQVSFQTAEAFYNGVRYTHNNYSCEWNGRKVHLSYSKKNGCGYISFGMNKAEEEAHKAKIEEERQKAEAEQIERRKRDPEKRAKAIEFYRHKIEILQQQWEGEKEDSDYDESDAEWYAGEIAKFESILAAYVS